MGVKSAACTWISLPPSSSFGLLLCILQDSDETLTSLGESLIPQTKLSSLLFLGTLYFFKDFIYLFLKRGEEREKEMERNIDATKKHQLVASRTRCDQDRTRNPGTCPDWKSNW